MTAFSALYRGHPFILIPDVVAEASGDRVLTMTYLDGLDWAAAQGADQDLKNTWAEVISRFLGVPSDTPIYFMPIPIPATIASVPTGESGSSISVVSRCCPNGSAAGSLGWRAQPSMDASTNCAI